MNVQEAKDMVEFLRHQFPVGSRVRLISTPKDDPMPIAVGSEGTLERIEDNGEFRVQWDDGRSLIATPGYDMIQIFPPRYVFGDYVFTPVLNAFNNKTSWWLSKKGYAQAMYCFTGDEKEAEDQLAESSRISYFTMFECATQKRQDKNS